MSKINPPRIRFLPLDKLLLDDANANKGTKRGREALAKSLKKYGAGRSVLVDKNGRVMAGNKTVEQARAAGMKQIAVVEVDGSTLVAVQRNDLDLKKDKRAKELAVADNRVAEMDLDWNIDVLKVVAVVCFVAVTAGALIGWLQHTAAQVARNDPQEVQAARPQLTPAQPGKPLTILVLGSDRRAGQPTSARAPTR